MISTTMPAEMDVQVPGWGERRITRLQADYSVVDELKFMHANRVLMMTTPYFNLTEEFQNFMLSRGQGSVFMINCPEGNSFHNASGAAGLIVPIYEYHAERFRKRVARSAYVQNRSVLLRWKKP